MYYVPIKGVIQSSFTWAWSCDVPYAVASDLQSRLLLHWMEALTYNGLTGLMDMDQQDLVKEI